MHDSRQTTHGKNRESLGTVDDSRNNMHWKKPCVVSLI